MADSPSSGHEIIAYILQYGHPTSYTITDLGGNWTGNTQIQSNTWYTYDTYVYCQKSSAQLQLILKNNGSQGKFYIDSISCDTVTPPAMTSPVTVPVSMGDFNVAADTSSWGFQVVPGAANGLPGINWISSYSGQSGVLQLAFNQINQGCKITAAPVYAIPANRNTVMSFKIRSDLSSPTTLQILGYLYSEKDLATFKVDLSGIAKLGSTPGNQWATVMIPLTSVSGNTSFRMQMVIKNQSQSPENIYIDDVQLIYRDSVSLSELEDGDNSKPELVSKLD
jgi:hypothetical protein